ncbi:MAG: hypothetical protein F6K24_13870 [Okeania sp. SIO2D1]|nr:hypothetical protein [Okeania sp. SIO2D1]
MWGEIIQKARSQETGDNPPLAPNPDRGGEGKREDVGRNNTKNSTHQHEDFRIILMREKT